MSHLEFPAYLGTNPNVIPFANHEYTMQLLEVFQYIQITALALVKLSALLFYRRIFGARDRRHAFEIMISVTFIVLVLWFAAMILMNSLQCGTTISALWTHINAVDLCVYIEGYELAFATSNVSLDIWILVLPLPQIAKLNTTRSRKLACMTVFLLALA